MDLLGGWDGLDCANLVVVVSCDITSTFFQTHNILHRKQRAGKIPYLARKFGKKIEDNNRFILVDINFKKMCLARNSNSLYFVFR